MDELDRMIKRFSKLTASVEIGVFDEKNAQKLSYAEFGTRTAPPRPVLSATYDQAESSLDRAIDKALGQVIDGKDMTGGQLLQGVGEDLAELVKDQIHGSFGKALKPSTLKARRKRGNPDSTTLIDRSSLEPGDQAMVDAIQAQAQQGLGDNDEE
jgi:hypothetical protein